MTLVIATTNPHKYKEYSTMLHGLPLSSLANFPPMVPVAEDAPTFVENAVKKAVAAHEHTGACVLADDSGIEVAALHGAPGVRSARYAAGSDTDRYEALLEAMDGQADRRARFTCAIALAGVSNLGAVPVGLEVVHGCVVVRGHLEGCLALEARGLGGFGYDPIFELSHGQTVGELNAQEKHLISHRGRALTLLKPYLEALFR